MTPRPILDRVRRIPLGFGRLAAAPNVYDLFAFVLIAGAVVALAKGGGEMRASLAQLDLRPVELDPRQLPDYALRTVLRMFAAMGASLLFTFTVAPLAAKSRKAAIVIIPALDILQSVP